MSIPAATDGAVFCAWLEQVLLPELRRTRPDAVLVMDNLSAHKTKAVRALLDETGFAYLYLPRYSPDLNPAEMLWSKPKSGLRRAFSDTVEQMEQALGEAGRQFGSAEVAVWARHCGFTDQHQSV